MPSWMYWNESCDMQVGKGCESYCSFKQNPAVALSIHREGTRAGERRLNGNDYLNERTMTASRGADEPSRAIGFHER